MPPKIYKSKEEKKAAYALNKRMKRAADKLAKQRKNEEKPNYQWLSEILIKLVNEIPRKSELRKARKSSNAKCQAVKREALKQPITNVVSKRPKYAK